jgi:dynein heavy chain
MRNDCALANPFGRHRNPGYIGRAELPESLKALFRPITVVVPDRQLIMENMLMAEVRLRCAAVGRGRGVRCQVAPAMVSCRRHCQ